MLLGSELLHPRRPQPRPRPHFRCLHPCLYPYPWWLVMRMGVAVPVWLCSCPSSSLTTGCWSLLLSRYLKMSYLMAVCIHKWVSISSNVSYTGGKPHHLHLSSKCKFERLMRQPRNFQVHVCSVCCGLPWWAGLGTWVTSLRNIWVFGYGLRGYLTCLLTVFSKYILSRAQGLHRALCNWIEACYAFGACVPVIDNCPYEYVAGLGASCSCCWISAHFLIGFDPCADAVEQGL